MIFNGGGIYFYISSSEHVGGSVPFYQNKEIADSTEYKVSYPGTFNSNSISYSSNLDLDENETIVGLPVGQIGGGFSVSDVEALYIFN